MGRGTLVVNQECQMRLSPGTTMKNVAVDGATDMPALAAATTHVLLSVDTNTLVMTLDGTTPAATSNGHVLAAGYERIFCKDLAAGAKFIKSSAAGYVRVTELVRE